MKKLTKKDIKKVILNPFYAITINEIYSIDHEPMVSEEDWIKANVRLIKEVGTYKWLETLLEVLKGNYVS